MVFNEFVADTLLWMDDGYTIAIFPNEELVFHLNTDMKPIGSKLVRDRLLSNSENNPYYIVRKHGGSYNISARSYHGAI